MTQNIIKFLTAGNVDDGKSTLIGRLLHDANALYQDQIDEVKSATDASFDGDLDFSLFLDGLTSERAQKITIDVAYRYFSYQGQKLIIADAPGHEQYTRNMAVAAANSDVVIILIDATKGVKDQTLRHSYIAHLFGIKNVIVAINKMDLLDFSEVTFNQIRYDFLKKTKALTFDHIHFVPISAMQGTNIVKKSTNSWYLGKSLLDYLLESKNEQKASHALRLPIQNIIKHENKRFYQALLTNGDISIGDEIIAYPAKQSGKITKIIHASKRVDKAKKGSSIAINLDKEIDIERGSLLVNTNHKPRFSNQFNSHLIWFSDEAFHIENNAELLIKINHQYLRAKISKIHHILDINQNHHHKSNAIALNHIAHVELTLAKDIAFDLFNDNKHSGSFLLIDKTTNQTLACGVITESQATSDHHQTKNIFTKFINLFKGN